LETVAGWVIAVERSMVSGVERTLILAGTTTLSHQDDGDSLDPDVKEVGVYRGKFDTSNLFPARIQANHKVREVVIAIYN
jgi:hypothetical protein